METVTLEPLALEAGDLVRHLDVLEPQLAYVAPIDQMLGETREGVDFHLIRAGGSVVGFFKIDRPGASEHGFVAPGEIGLRGLLIGAQFQGRGYGRAFAAALPAYLARHYADAPRVTLAVDDDNPIARRLYRSGGWYETGETAHTRSGPSTVLKLDLAPLR